VAEKAQITLSAVDKTSAAFDSAKRNLSELQASAIGIAARFAGIAAGVGILGAAFDRINPKSVIDAADQLNKLNQRTGIAVETLSAYQFAARLADVSNEDLTTSLKKLNLNIAAAARGETEQAAAFKAIGVSVVDASGKVRTADQVFADIAERFSGYNDGANKVALANAVGGKSFEQLIPLLNGGKKGLEDSRKELEKFGGVIGSDLAAKSEKFNDNLTRLSVASNALKVSIAGGLIDRLVEYSDQAVEAAKSTGLLEFAFTKIGDLFTGKLTREFAFGKALDPDKLGTAQKEVDALAERIANLQAKLAANPGDTGLLKQLQLVQATAADANRSLAASQAKAFTDFRAAERRGADFSAAPVAKRDAPALAKTGAGDNAEALLRKQLEGRLKVIQQALENEQDLFKFSEQQLAEQYQHSEISIAQFYDAKNAIAVDALASQSAAAEKEVALFREFQAKLTKPQDRADLENRIVDTLAKQSKAYRESGQSAQVAEQQRVRATEEFQRSLKDVDAQLAELSGDKYGAELLRNAERFEAAQRLLTKGGEDGGRLNNLQTLLATQAEFNRLQERSTRINEAAQIAEETFLITAQRQGLSRNETEQQLLALREKSLASLDERIAKTAELTKTSADPERLSFYANLKLARERAFDAKDPGLQRFNELAQRSGEAIAGGFEDAIVEGKKFNDVLKDVEKQLIRLVTQDLVTKPLADSISGFVKSLGAGGTGGGADRLFSGIGASVGGGRGAGAAGGGAFGAIFDKVGGFFASLFGGGGGFGSGSSFGNQDLGAFFHNGGLVGAGGTYKLVDSAAWINAPRYHGGGIAGLKADEVPAILRRGEEVLRQNDPRHRDNSSSGGPVVVNQTFNTQGAVDTRTRLQMAADAQLSLGRARRNL
jgi:hypothetical protein